MGAESCDPFLPATRKYSHEDKVRLHNQEPFGHPDKEFYDTLAQPFNDLAKRLNLADVEFLFAVSSWESGWLNIENKALHNPFGLTAAGKDNLEFVSIQDACNYWACKIGPYVKGAKTLEDFINGLKKSKYNPDPNYFNLKKWGLQFHSVGKHRKEWYVKEKDGDTLILKPKPKANSK